MRVLHILEAVEGGAALHVRHLLTDQARRHEVSLAVPTRRSWGRTDGGVSSDLESEGVTVVPIAMHRNPVHPRNAGSIVALARLVRRRRPDIVHTHATTAGVLGRVVAAATGVPTVHTQNGARFADPLGGLSARAGRWVETVLRPFTGIVIAVSESEAAVYRTVQPPDRVLVIPNCIPVDGAVPNPMPTPPLVVSISRFAYPKDPVLAVRVMAAARAVVPDARALLVGYGELEAEVRAAVIELDPGIEVRSDIPGAEAVASATVVLLCTRREGGPYVPLEAMERSRAVVATDVIGCRDVVEDGVTGFLFPHGDASAGGDLVARLLSNATLATDMGSAGRRRLVDRFSVEAMSAAVDEAYARALTQ